ncbi:MULTISPECIES: MFS transporter [unclassified Undibacterium]|uniref:MFS transporter n=1 Tax=unclassified Undibacterium TaxID=2630295 RepID=UPI002AC91406|nr:MULTISPECIES: MFS transporter [unclassified Undibacterium]MEB0138551.1 MFS transporter [Undibacterium sp. CCC2.1]MEB0171385.1 MFS transporter [Undibacterium sp. CCC1.1]MEB0175315.1 MFS transporter [Undibacterium sp. CCC3.4]MEB0214581.1 MFS transporter [Undibacterium sp. 5I2]WPX43044.1 MFS transporter [Undibacterium sp. CCC3.4]
MQKISTLSRAALLFPLSLVCFEFSVYIANDMIQPGMLTVIREFAADPTWIASAMTAFLIGGMLLQWLFGPLSDRIGRRPVMLGGALFFICSCLATLLVNSIEGFIVLRVAQGIGLCFISSVGYAVVHEAFEEKAAIQVTALMSNVALIAPLLGPVAGALLVGLVGWRMIFVIIAAIAAIGFVGLLATMPETVRVSDKKIARMQIWHDYQTVFRHWPFVRAALCGPLLTMPLIAWIALSPMIFVADHGMSLTQYGYAQFPIFICLIIGNLYLARQIHARPLGHSVRLGWYPIAAGLAVMLAGSVLFESPYFLIPAISLIAFGEGISNAVIVRFTLTESTVSKATVAAAMGILNMCIWSVGIEVYKLVYLHTGLLGFAILSCLALGVYAILARSVITRAMAVRSVDSGTTCSA